MGIKFYIEEVATIGPHDDSEKARKMAKILEEMVEIELPTMMMVYATGWEKGFMDIVWLAEKESKNGI